MAPFDDILTRVLQVALWEVNDSVNTNPELKRRGNICDVSVSERVRKEILTHIKEIVTQEWKLNVHYTDVFAIMFQSFPAIVEALDYQAKQTIVDDIYNRAIDAMCVALHTALVTCTRGAKQKLSVYQIVTMETSDGLMLQHLLKTIIVQFFLTDFLNSLFNELILIEEILTESH